jgi:Peptidase family M48
MIRAVCILVALCSTAARAQAPSPAAPAQSFHGAVPSVEGALESNSEAEEIVKRIVTAVGVPSPRFRIVVAGRIANASAWIQGNERFIGYDPKFMQAVHTTAGRNYFSLIGILAHEIGHHFLGHTVEDLGAESALAARPAKVGEVRRARTAIGLADPVLERRRLDELDADFFSGFVLARLGATKEDTTSWLAGIPDPGPGASHPRNAERRRFIETGWTNARQQIQAAPVRSRKSFWDHNGSQMRMLQDGQRRLIQYEQPREAVTRRGVDKGTVLFDGQADGDAIEGLIYAFSVNCGKFGYRVTGKIEDGDRRIVLEGQHPVIDRACKIIRHDPERLVFTFLREG